MLRALLKLRVGLRGPGWRYEAHSLRSEAKHNICRLIYHSAHLIPLLSLPASFVSTLVHHRRLCYHGLLFISELKVRIIQAVLAALANLVREISFVLNPKHRHIKLRNEKILLLRQHFSSLHFSLVLHIFTVIILGETWDSNFSYRYFGIILQNYLIFLFCENISKSIVTAW